ncbi:CLCA_X family protein [Oceanospirillum linum]
MPHNDGAFPKVFKYATIRYCFYEQYREAAGATLPARSHKPTADSHAPMHQLFHQHKALSDKEQRFYRNGPRHRQDGHCDFLQLRQRFNFRSIEIGRWVTQQEKLSAADRFYDALCDLMLILQVPESVISLKGTLALHYGTGGRPGVAAHYAPNQRAFALAKNAGPGSIAHEWFHALDHYLANKSFRTAEGIRFASDLWLQQGRGGQDLIAHPLNHKLSDCFAAVMLSENGEEPSELFRMSLLADKATGLSYYSQPEELCARAFEAFVQDAQIKNNFLVKGTKASTEAQYGLYPRGAERNRINAHFADYFAMLGRAVRKQVEGCETNRSTDKVNRFR